MEARGWIRQENRSGGVEKVAEHKRGSGRTVKGGGVKDGGHTM